MKLNLFSIPVNVVCTTVKNHITIMNHNRIQTTQFKYPDEVFCGFSVPPGECRNSTLKLGHDQSYQILSNSSLYIYHPIIDAM
jgi:hypothetical protein